MSLRITTANIDFAVGGDKRYLAHLCEGADVLLLQEAKNVNLRAALPDGWVSLQDDASEATRGSCIAYREATVARRWHGFSIGARPWIAARRIGMLERWIARAGLTEIATGRKFTAISAHFPPARFRVLQPGMGRNLKRVVTKQQRKWPVVIGTDANQPIGGLAHALGLEAFGRGIVGLLTDGSWTNGNVAPWGIQRGLTDHPSVTFTLHIKEKR